MAAEPGHLPLTVVVLTHNRARELEHTLWRLATLPERPQVIVVDNASTDGTAERVRQRFPRVQLVRNERNLGAAGRNAGVAQVRTRYVAFCDDDTWWEPGALAHAAAVLDAHPGLAAVAARVLVEPGGREDPTCQVMAHSPLDAAGLPGPALIGFMAGAAVMRTSAFRAVGGYEPRLFLGAEERLLGLDLAARGWGMAYVHDLVAHHRPSANRDGGERRALLLRNELWIAWMRLPARSAWYVTAQLLRAAVQAGRLPQLLGPALRGLPWVLWRRRVLPPAVEAMRQQVLGGPRRRAAL